MNANFIKYAVMGFGALLLVLILNPFVVIGAGERGVVLAGFMRILTPAFVQYFEGKLLNIHPSLLPYYKGLHTHQRVLATGDNKHGCSVHFVNAELDGGAVIAQAVIDVLVNDNEHNLIENVHKHEHTLYPLVLSWLSHGRLRYQSGLPVLDGKVLMQPVRLLC